MHFTAYSGADNTARSTANRAESKAVRLDREIDELQRHVNRLTLISQSFWELLRERTALTEEDLERKIVEVDLRDQKLDRKITPSVCQCPRCGRNTNSTRYRCLICGAELDRPHIFEG